MTAKSLRTATRNFQKLFPEESSCFASQTSGILPNGGARDNAAAGANGRNGDLAARIDRMSRVIFPSLYIFSVLTFFCRYLDSP